MRCWWRESDFVKPLVQSNLRRQVQMLRRGIIGSRRLTRVESRFRLAEEANRIMAGKIEIWAAKRIFDWVLAFLTFGD